MSEAKSMQSNDRMNWSDDSVLEVNICLLEAEHVSRVIGTRGQTIKKICTDSGTYISFSKNNQFGTVKGKKDSIIKAVALIAEELAKEEGDKVSLELIIPETEVGKVIGKKGATIRRLEEENKTAISVSSGSNGQQPIKITGPAEGVASVSSFIVRCVEFDSNSPSSYFGYVAQNRPNTYKQQMSMASDYSAQMDYQAASQVYERYRANRGRGTTQKGAMSGAMSGAMPGSMPLQHPNRSRWISSGQVEMNIVLENPEEVSKIIGNQGTTIKRICSESSTWISFAKDNQVGTIKGKKENLVNAVRLMISELRDNELDGELVISLIVPSPEVAKIIGKRGATVKKIEEESGAGISVSSGIRQLVKLSGTADAVFSAADQIIQIVDFTNTNSVPSLPGPPSNNELPPDMESNQTDMKVKIVINEDLVSSIIGHGGEGIKYIACTSGVRISFSREEIYEEGTETGIISGKFNNILFALKLLGQKLLQQTDYGNLYSLVLVVPTNTVGWIIGKGGNTIQDTIRRSRAKISVSREKMEIINIEESLITIEGTNSAVDVACSTILEQLSRFRSLN